MQAYIKICAVNHPKNINQSLYGVSFHAKSESLCGEFFPHNNESLYGDSYHTKMNICKVNFSHTKMKVCMENLLTQEKKNESMNCEI